MTIDNRPDPAGSRAGRHRHPPRQQGRLRSFAKSLSGPQRAALAAQKFDGGGYQVGIVPDGDGWFAVGGVADPDELSSWCMAKLAEELPAGTYRLRRRRAGPGACSAGRPRNTASPATAGRRGRRRPAHPADQGGRRRSSPRSPKRRRRCWCATSSTRPAEDMGPAALEAEAETLAKAARRPSSRSRAAMRWSRNSRWSTPSAAPPRAAMRRG